MAAPPSVDTSAIMERIMPLYSNNPTRQNVVCRMLISLLHADKPAGQWRVTRRTGLNLVAASAAEMFRQGLAARLLELADQPRKAENAKVVDSVWQLLALLCSAKELDVSVLVEDLVSNSSRLGSAALLGWMSHDPGVQRSVLQCAAGLADHAHSLGAPVWLMVLQAHSRGITDKCSDPLTLLAAVQLQYSCWMLSNDDHKSREASDNIVRPLLQRSLHEGTRSLHVAVTTVALMAQCWPASQGNAAGQAAQTTGQQLLWGIDASVVRRAAVGAPCDSELELWVLRASVALLQVPGYAASAAPQSWLAARLVELVRRMEQLRCSNASEEALQLLEGAWAHDRPGGVLQGLTQQLLDLGLMQTLAYWVAALPDASVVQVLQYMDPARIHGEAVLRHADSSRAMVAAVSRVYGVSKPSALLAAVSRNGALLAGNELLSHLARLRTQNSTAGNTQFLPDLLVCSYSSCCRVEPAPHTFKACGACSSRSSTAVNTSDRSRAGSTGSTSNTASSSEAGSSRASASVFSNSKAVYCSRECQVADRRTGHAWCLLDSLPCKGVDMAPGTRKQLLQLLGTPTNCAKLQTIVSIHQVFQAYVKLAKAGDSAYTSDVMAWVDGRLGAKLVTFLNALQQHRAVEVAPAGDADRAIEALASALGTIDFLLVVFDDSTQAFAHPVPLACAAPLLKQLLGEPGWLAWAFREAADSAPDEQAPAMGLCCSVGAAIAAMVRPNMHLSAVDREHLAAATAEAMATVLTAPVLKAISTFGAQLVNADGATDPAINYIIIMLAVMVERGVSVQQLQLFVDCRGLGEVLSYALSRSMLPAASAAALNALELLLSLWQHAAPAHVPLVYAEHVLQPLCDVLVGRPASGVQGDILWSLKRQRALQLLELAVQDSAAKALLQEGAWLTSAAPDGFRGMSSGEQAGAMAVVSALNANRQGKASKSAKCSSSGDAVSSTGAGGSKDSEVSHTRNSNGGESETGSESGGNSSSKHVHSSLKDHDASNGQDRQFTAPAASAANHVDQQAGSSCASSDTGIGMGNAQKSRSPYAAASPSTAAAHDDIAANRDKDCCVTCGATGKLLRCGRCRRVKFCSASCQRAAWPSHKAVCKA